MYTVHFGLNFDKGVFPTAPTESVGGVLYVGERGVLHFAEVHLGLSGYPEKMEHLRTEQYRQALARYLKTNPAVFYNQSFEADQLACAQALLMRRDELLLAGWDFEPEATTPPRLKVLADIEHTFLKDATTGNSKLIAGFADRFDAVLKKLVSKVQILPVSQWFIHTPFELLPPHIKRFFRFFTYEIMDKNDLKKPDNATDLGIFKQFIQDKVEKGARPNLKADGSLLILETDRDTEAAHILAKILTDNPDFKPVFLIPDRNRTLDEALIQNGLPAFGLPSASLGRPTLQLLKLVTAFIWRPLDPYKILEFVTLPAKPLDADLANVIANVMAQRPGVGSDIWFYEVNHYFEKLAEKAQTDSAIDVNKIKQQFNFWFDRTTYDIAKSAPKDEITALFAYLKEWASAEYEASGSKSASLLVLSEQAKRIEEFLNELPPNEQFLTALELERIIRTIYEPAPVQPKPQELGHYPYVEQGDCLLERVEDLIWWNFTDTEGVHFFSKWYRQEMDFLRQNNIVLQTPQVENALMLWQRVQPILSVNRRLILIYPKKINGESTTEHPLFSHLRACFKNIEAITFKINDLKSFKQISGLDTPRYVRLEGHRLGKVQPFIHVASPLLTHRAHETLTSLETMFYYPHQWVFRHKARLTKSPILSVVKENTLKGNMAHRFFELVLKENFTNWDKKDVDAWVEEKVRRRILEREAATLLMYGNEPDRVQFISQVKYAIRTLITHIRANNWLVEATEQDLAGSFGALPVKGKADVVLLRGSERCVLDLKWSGHSYRERLIKNGEDLQLVMYSRLLTNDDDWAHTAYFIIDKALILARNTSAFKDIKPLMPNADSFALNAMVWAKMLSTYHWRLSQITEGVIEIRTAQTAPWLEEEYGATLLDVLEMKKEDDRFDDYRTLVGLVK